MTKQQEEELEELNRKITELLDAMTNAPDLETYDLNYDAFIEAHDRREVLLAVLELDEMLETA